MQLRESVDEMLESSELALSGETREVIEAYRLFAHDQGWRQRLRDAIRTGLTAEAAVERVQDETRARIIRTNDPYLRERLHDFDDLARRLMRHLAQIRRQAREPRAAGQRRRHRTRHGTGRAAGLWPQPARRAGRGGGDRRPRISPSSRARWAFRWSARVEDIADAARSDDTIVVDAETGEVHLRPLAEVVAAFRAKRALLAQRVARFAAIRDVPAVTKDGVHVRLNMNAGLLLDLPHLAESGADGIGLFRTELQFMIGTKMPRLTDQISFYRQVMDAAGDKPVVFRTLDLGGDKIPAYGRAGEREENPALGWRAIRIALDRPALLRYQVRALIAAADGRRSASASADGQRGRRIRGREGPDRPRGRARPAHRDAAAQAHPPGRDDRGAVAALRAAAAAEGRRFRLHRLERSAAVRLRRRPHQSAVARRYDTLSPAVLNLVRRIVDARREAGSSVEVSLCGEMAGRPLEAMALVGLGITSLSMQASMIGPVKMMIRNLDTRQLRPVLERLCGISAPSARTAPQRLRRRATEFPSGDGAGRGRLRIVGAGPHLVKIVPAKSKAGA